MAFPINDDDFVIGGSEAQKYGHATFIIGGRVRDAFSITHRVYACLFIDPTTYMIGVFLHLSTPLFHSVFHPHLNIDSNQYAGGKVAQVP